MSRPSCFSAYFRSTARSASLFSHLSFTTQTYSADARALKFTRFAGVESHKIAHAPVRRPRAAGAGRADSAAAAPAPGRSRQRRWMRWPLRHLTKRLVGPSGGWPQFAQVPSANSAICDVTETCTVVAAAAKLLVVTDGRRAATVDVGPSHRGRGRPAARRHAARRHHRRRPAAHLL